MCDEHQTGDEKEANFWRLKKKKEENLSGDPGRSLTQEVVLLREQVAQLTQATRALVTLQSVMDKKLDAALKGGVGADFAVL